MKPDKASPRELAEKLAGLIPDVSADDLLLAQTNSVAISPDGRYIVATNRFDRITHVWRLPENPASNEPATSFRLDIDDGLDVWSAAFSPFAKADGTRRARHERRPPMEARHTEEGKSSPRRRDIEPPRRSGLDRLLARRQILRHRKRGTRPGRPRVERANREGTWPNSKASIPNPSMPPSSRPNGQFILTVQQDNPARRDETMVLWKLTRQRAGPLPSRK